MSVKEKRNGGDKTNIYCTAPKLEKGQDRTGHGKGYRRVRDRYDS